MNRIALVVSCLLAAAGTAPAQDAIQAAYTKQEVSIPMRDGKKLFTSTRRRTRRAPGPSC